MTAPTSTDGAVRRAAESMARIADHVEQAIRGKRDVIELLVLALVAEGHVLIEDVPGVGKTTLAKALARSVDTTFGRVQFTPDLLPSDVVGVTVWNRARGEFEFRPGPVFAGVVLADEINRAAPKTQSALLEAMAEGQVTVDGHTHGLARPFLVLATQNPIEHEGTYPLPESQLDRFLMRISVGYPSRAAELEILEVDGAAHVDAGPPALEAAEVVELAETVERTHVAPALRGYLVELAEASRRHPHLALGMSPRATLSLQRVARARAASQERHYVVPDDLKLLAAPVLAHRLVVTPEAQLQGTTSLDALDDVLRTVPVPSRAD